MNQEGIDGDSGEIDPFLIDEFELKFNVRLPIAYRNLVQFHDAPYLKKNHFEFINTHHNDLWSYRLKNNGYDSRDVTFFGFGESLPDYEKIDQKQDFDTYGHEHVIAFGAAANGDHICFDFRYDPSTIEPHVVVLFHDAYDENRRMAICHVADSFDKFLDMLY